MSVKQYIKTKIEVLKQLGIVLDPYQLKYIKTLKTDYEVDRYARDIIMRSDQDYTMSPLYDVKNIEFVTTRQAAKKLNVSCATISYLIKNRRLKAYKASDLGIKADVLYLIRADELEKFSENYHPKRATRT